MARIENGHTEVAEKKHTESVQKTPSVSLDIVRSLTVSIPEYGVQKQKRDIQLRFIRVNDVELPVPLIDTKIGSEPSIDFMSRATELAGLATRAQCTPDIIGWLRSCGFYDEQTTGGTSRSIYQDDQIRGGDAKIIDPKEFGRIMGITIDPSKPDYNKYRKALHDAKRYDKSRTFMTDVASWLTEIYKKSQSESSVPQKPSK